MTVVSNAWSVSMLQGKAKVSFEPVSLEQARELVKGGVVSIIGHEGTAWVFTQKLGVHLRKNRVFFKMTKDEVMLVGELNQRLPEGKVLTAEELEEIPIRWWVVRLV